MLSTPVKLYIFDVDGTLRWTRVPGQHCPYAPEEWELMPNVHSILSSMNWGPEGALLGIASNQNVVSDGFLTRKLSERMIRDTVRKAIGYFPDGAVIEVCTHALHEDCPCRKPKPGMLLSILKNLEVSPSEAVYVGDLEIDHEAASSAGVRFIWSHEFFCNSSAK